MPIYEYECSACARRHEIMQKITDSPLTSCPSCGGSMKKIVSNTSFVLKGSGWYATDYASDRKKGSTTEAKTETKTETKTSAST